MKLSLTILGLMTISFSAYAKVGNGTATPMQNCIAKVETMISLVGATANLGKDVGHIEGIKVVSVDKKPNGKIVYTLGGSPLGAEDQEGYSNESSAVTLVTLTKTSCEILKTEIITGKHLEAEIDL